MSAHVPRVIAAITAAAITATLFHEVASFAGPEPVAQATFAHTVVAQSHSRLQTRTSWLHRALEG